MPCPTCDHTMKNLPVEGNRLFWCPRCGTLKEEGSDRDSFESPFWIAQMLGTNVGKFGEAFNEIVDLKVNKKITSVLRNQ